MFLVVMWQGPAPIMLVCPHAGEDGNTCLMFWKASTQWCPPPCRGWCAGRDWTAHTAPGRALASRGLDGTDLAQLAPPLTALWLSSPYIYICSFPLVQVGGTWAGNILQALGHVKHPILRLRGHLHPEGRVKSVNLNSEPHVWMLREAPRKVSLWQLRPCASMLLVLCIVPSGWLCAALLATVVPDPGTWLKRLPGCTQPPLPQPLGTVHAAFVNCFNLTSFAGCEVVSLYCTSDFRYFSFSFI